MTREEALQRIVDNNFACEYGFDLQILIDCMVVAREIVLNSQFPSEDCISRAELLKAIDTWDRFGVDDTNSLFRLDNLSLPHYVSYIHYDDVIKCIEGMPSVNPQEPKTGHWSRKTKVDAYDIAGVKTWGIKCQCDRCDFTTIVVEDFGYYKYCPNCGCRMVEPQESEE